MSTHYNSFRDNLSLKLIKNKIILVFDIWKSTGTGYVVLLTEYPLHMDTFQNKLWDENRKISNIYFLFWFLIRTGHNYIQQIKRLVFLVNGLNRKTHCRRLLGVTSSRDLSRRHSNLIISEPNLSCFLRAPDKDGARRKPTVSLAWQLSRLSEEDSAGLGELTDWSERQKTYWNVSDVYVHILSFWE